MKYFKTVNGQLVNLRDHTLTILNQHPNAKIHIGTDSQNSRKKTTYATVVAYRYGSRGVHYIYNKSTQPEIRDLWTRLFSEAQLSIEIAEWLTSQINVKVEIDMDYNEDEVCKSAVLISTAKGWATSLGFPVNVKPDELVATRAADYHCR